MAQECDIQAMADKIRALKQSAIELKEMSGGMQAVDRNIDRILANIRMLEININDVLAVI